MYILQLTFWGVCVASTLLLAWGSGNAAMQKLALLLLAAWALSNLALAFLGYRGEPLVVPSLDAVIAILVAMVGFNNRSRAALTVFLLYAVLGVVHIAAFTTNSLSEYGYYIAKNGLFLAQLMVVGGVSTAGLVRRWTGWRHQRLYPHPAGRP